MRSWTTPSESDVAFLRSIPGNDPTMRAVHVDGWQGLHDASWLYVLERGDEHFLLTINSSVMASSNEPEWTPHPASLDEVLEAMADMERRVREFEATPSPGI